MTPDSLRASIANRLFGSNLIQNNLRSEVVEEIISIALPDGWNHCAKDWASWDFEHKDGFCLEIKQSAAKQTWQTTSKTSPRFDIAKRKGFWDGSDWKLVTEERRFADAYIFAWHPVLDDTCNHFDASQWEFFVVKEIELPNTKSIALSVIRNIVEPCKISDLASYIEHIRIRADI